MNEDRQAAGAEIRWGATPMATRVGIDYNRWHREPPRTPEARAFGVLMCGSTLLRAFADPEAWPTKRARDARRAAKAVKMALRMDCGRGAASLAAQQFGRALALAAELAGGDGAAETAARDRWLAELAQWAWPAPPSDWASEVVLEHEAAAHMPPPPPHAAHERKRARCTLQALGVALGPDEFERVLPMFFNVPSYLQFLSGLERNWEWVGVAWENLRAEDPVSPSDVMDRQARLVERSW